MNIKKVASFLAIILVLVALVAVPKYSANAKSITLEKKEYSKVIKSVKKKYGIYKGSKNESMSGRGLMYVKLIDFNQDQSPELHMIYGKNKKVMDITDTKQLIEEVWTINNKKAKRIHYQKHTYYGVVENIERSTVKIKGKNYLVSFDRYKGLYIKLKEFKGGKFVNSAQISRASDPTGNEYYDYWKKSNKNSKSISRVQFNKLYKQFNLKKRNIVMYSDSGMRRIKTIKTSI